MPEPTAKPSLRQRASSLVTTLMVIVVLTVIVVAFMQSMSIERMTSRSYANKYQAELMAEAATAEAVNRIFDAIYDVPHSAAYYGATVAGSPALHLYLARYTNQSGALATVRIPLFSTQTMNFSAYTSLAQPPIQTTAVTVTNRSEAGVLGAVSLAETNDIYVNLNQSNSYYPTGIVGLTNATGPVPMPVNWIYQTNNLGRVIGRYAFWVDDESSKVDLRTAGTVARAGGTNLAEVSLAGFTNLGLSAGQVSNLAAYKSVDFSGKTVSAGRYDLGGNAAISTTNLWNRVRPHLTQYSRQDLRSPDGNLAINLNEYVTTTTSAARIQEEVETIVTAITNNLPDFGKRYYQATGGGAAPATATPNAADQRKYVRKIAANIRDFIDADNTATVIFEDEGGAALAYTGNAPGFISLFHGGPQDNYEDDISELPIMGKELGPYLNEFALVTRVISPDPENTTAGSTTAVTIIVRFGHYVELFNPSSQAITYSQLGPNPRIVIANQITWGNKHNGSIFRPADVRLDLPATFTIPAQGYAVITTDGPPFTTATANQSDYLGSSDNRYLLTKGSGPGTWSLLGTPGQNSPLANSAYEDYQIATANLGDNRYNVQMNGGTGTASYADCRERLLFVNDNGIIDYTLRIYTVGAQYLGRYIRNPAVISTFVSDGNTSNNNTNPENTSNPRLVRGDPRSNTEITEIGANTSSSWKSGNSPKYGNTYTGSSGLQMSLGTTNYNWSVSTGTANIWRDSWAEYSSAGNGYIANTNLTSVGDLGFIYDPARYSISWHRSNGRTLRVGQPDIPNFNRNNNSTAANDQNWTGGLGVNATTSANYLKNAFMLANVFRTDNREFGKVNPNGVFRGTDRALLASLFNNFAFESTNGFKASGTLVGKTLNTNALYTAMTNEFAANRGFIGIGDVSRLEVFGTSTTSSSIATGQSMSAFAVSDADREEVFRRTAGLLSTQSLSYSVYAIGQSGRIVNGKFKASSTSKMSSVVQFEPTYDSTNYPARPSSWSIARPWRINY